MLTFYTAGTTMLSNSGTVVAVPGQARTAGATPTSGAAAAAATTAAAAANATDGGAVML